MNSIQETKEKTGEIVYWFGTPRGLSKYSKGKWETFTTKNNSLVSNYISDICKTTDGSLWIATDHGVSHYVNGTLQNFALPKEFQGGGINKIIQGKNGELWFAGIGTIGRYANKKWTVFHITNAKKNSRIITMYESSNGDLWFGSAEGIMRISNASNDEVGKNIEYFFIGTEFENMMGDIFCIQETPGGEIWFGTLLGLFRYIPGKWETLSEKTGLKNTSITYIYETSKGDYYFGTPRGLFQYHNGYWKIFDNKTGLSNNFIKAILEAKDGTIWVGTLGGGVNHLVNGKWFSYEVNNGLPDSRVYSILQSNDGAVWFATARGVSKYYKGTWTLITTANGLVENQVMSLYQSQDSSIWFGTRSGLSRLFRGQFQTYNTSNGLCGNVVQSINSASDGSLWFGTPSSGASQFNPGNNIWKTYNDASTPPIINNVVSQVVEDRFRHLYFLTNKGVARFSPEEWLLSNKRIAFNKTLKVPLVENFSVDDGLPADEGMVRAAMVDSKGKIWIGTTQGIAYFDPANEIRDTLKKNILIEKISIKNFSRIKPLESGIELSYKNNNIEFEYALLSFFKESKTLYQTQLFPYEVSPNSWSSSFRKEYTNLSDGNYVFRVWGKDYLGNTSGPAEFAFIIRPPFWKTWWFISFQILIFVGIIYLIIRIITTQKFKKHLARLERQQLIELERGRISKDMHDTVGSSLTRITILSDSAKIEIENSNVRGKVVEGIRGKITSIGETAREVIDTMNEIIWSLSPRYDTLESLINYMRIYINSMLVSNSLRCSLDIQTSIPNIPLTPDVRRNIFLIFKESVNNLVKYANATEVTITVTVVDHILAFTIHDNGIGFSERGYNGSTRTGSGLVNMRERATALGAKLDIASGLGKGTTITFKYTLIEMSFK